MGFPMIQVFMIAARQVSKPVADMVLKYGKDHPLFRNKILLPIGRGLVRLTTRLRMKRLGLGEPTVKVQISEAAALEQASDFVQQTVLFTYSLGVFTGYYFYTNWNAPDNVKPEHLKELADSTSQSIEELQRRINKLEELVEHLTNIKVTAIASNSSQQTEKKPEFKRISSLPVDEAALVVLKDEGAFLVVRRGSSVGIEDEATFRSSGTSLRYRKKELLLSPPREGLIGSAERIVLALLGRWTE